MEEYKVACRSPSLADDVNMSDVNNDDDSEWWRMFLTPAHTATLNEAAEDEIKFTKLARHFWGRLVLFHRSWSVDQKNKIFEHCVGEFPPPRERGRPGLY